jgi:hypothetical protein
MPEFGKRSRTNLMTCDRRLQDLLGYVVEHFDCAVICGHRTREEQEKAFREGRSKARFGRSRHNTLPSKAVDVVPWPLDWSDRERFHHFAGFVLGVAATKGIDLRWGGDWDRDTEVQENAFDDLPHFELVE